MRSVFTALRDAAPFARFAEHKVIGGNNARANGRQNEAACH
jgi:hypothetical protein